MSNDMYDDNHQPKKNNGLADDELVIDGADFLEDDLGDDLGAEDLLSEDLDSDELNNEEDGLLAEDEEEPSEETPQINQSVGGLGGISLQAVGGVKTDVDIVFVIDCTGSMEPLLNAVKEKALGFDEEVKAALGTKSRQLNRLRIKVIGYRDHYVDWQDPTHPPIQESDFFSLPEEKEAFSEFLNGLTHAGGEDEPESGLEALHLAFNSRWFVDPQIPKRRQIIVLFTDASAHPLNSPKRYDSEWNSHYPEGIPAELEDLQEEYSNPDIFPADSRGIVNGHRLILFAPDSYPWNKINTWDAVTRTTMDPAKGLRDINMVDVINLIAGSM